MKILPMLTLPLETQSYNTKTGELKVLSIYTASYMSHVKTVELSCDDRNMNI